ncbi:MAG TPA: AMP-binding protein, partial [Bellilinea sp.]|nr:AMP-binding protein [Bellilinea sp.]
MTEFAANTIAHAIASRHEWASAPFAFFSDKSLPLTSEDHFAGARRVALRLVMAYRGKWRKGVRVLIVAPTGPDLLVSLAGCWLAGAMAAPVDISLPDEGFQQVLRQFHPEIMLIDERVDFDGSRTAMAKAAGCIAIEDIS